MSKNRDRKKGLEVWFLAIRPRTLPAAISPVLVASSLAHYHNGLHLPAASMCCLIALFLQIGANLANDVFDYKKGVDVPERLGPVRVTSAGLLSPRKMYIGVTIAISLAMLASLYLVWLRGLPVVILGLGLILASLLYTGGPFPYGYHAL